MREIYLCLPGVLGWLFFRRTVVTVSGAESSVLTLHLVGLLCGWLLLAVEVFCQWKGGHPGLGSVTAGYLDMLPQMRSESGTRSCKAKLMVIFQ